MNEAKKIQFKHFRMIPARKKKLQGRTNLAWDVIRQGHHPFVPFILLRTLDKGGQHPMKWHNSTAFHEACHEPYRWSTIWQQKNNIIISLINPTMKQKAIKSYRKPFTYRVGSNIVCAFLLVLGIENLQAMRAAVAFRDANLAVTQQNHALGSLLAFERLWIGQV